MEKRAAVALGVVLACCRCAVALNPSFDINQYAHKSWTIREGFFKGAIYSIAQTPDGYLWLGTEFGLVRFDGVRFTQWQPPSGDRLPNTAIWKLLVTRNGRLWIGTAAGLSSWKDSKLVHYPALAGQAVGALLEDREGTVWVGGEGVPTGRLCAIQSGGAARCFGQDGRLGRFVLSLLEENGNLWAGAETGLWRWEPGPPKVFAVPEPEVPDLNQTDDGHLLIAMHGGIRQLVDGHTKPYPIRGSKPFSGSRLLRDRTGGLWIGTTARGLLHLHEGLTDSFSRSDGLSGDYITSLLEDREGTVWVATTQGIDRFRDLAVSTVSVKQGLSTDNIWSVLAAKDGSVWLGTRAGLNWWDHGAVTTLSKADGLPELPQSLYQDDGGRIWVFTSHGLARFEQVGFVPVSGVPGRQVQAITGDNAGNLGLAEEQGLLRLRDGHLVEEIPWRRLSRKVAPITLLAGREPGGLWLGSGFSDSGVVYLQDGQIRASYSATDGLGKGQVTGLLLDPDGTLWVATEGGLSVITNGRVTTLTSKNGLCDTVHWVMEDDDDAMWLYTACGLMRVTRAELEAGVADPKRTIQAAIFDNSDGVTLHPDAFSGYSPRVAKSPDGKLWFVSGDGVSVIDPRHLPINKLPPPVHIEQIIADDKPYDLRPGMRLPANVRSLRIEYTALSLVAPEKIHFKYKLEGQNRNWHEVINERQATYTNLPPRNYRFRVIASNNSGVWNETGDRVEFSIDPAYYQTTWFYASCVGAFLAMLWGLYRLRLYQVQREFNAQLDGRVEERMRVARELHDTLLQSFQASLIQMQAARNVLARRPEKAEQSIDKAITTAAGAVAEGRNAIQNLRAQPAGGGDLAELLTAAGQELAHSDEAQGNPPVFRVTVEGERRDLVPLLQDEVYRIARELLRNAVRHAQAGHIEAEIRYESRQLCVHVRDDGKGVDPEILKAGGRAGHYGLPGMRERAARLGGKLEFWSDAGAGTEAVLTVPAAAAYGASNGGSFSFLRRKKARS